MEKDPPRSVPERRYFLTGATGFVGRHLVEQLLVRGGTVDALIPEFDVDRLDELRARWGVGVDRVRTVVGDLEQPLLGLRPAEVRRLRGQIDHVVHAAALDQLLSEGRRVASASIRATRNAVYFANTVRPGCFHYVSSCAVAGRYRGVFRENMFEEATDLADPYCATKHVAERIVRKRCAVPWRIYRPGIVVGHSRSGEMDKVDGPYHLFSLLQWLAAVFPSWVPFVGLGGGILNLVPVDFVARAIDHIAHVDGLDGRTFHLVDPKPKSAVDTINVFARTAHTSRIAFDASRAGRVPTPVRRAVVSVPWQLAALVLRRRFGVPARVLALIDWPTEFDSRHARAALAGTDIKVPRLETYADRLWEYWENFLDVDLRTRPALRRVVRGRRVLITGASSGIGRAAAIKLGAAGATVLLVARSADRLDHIRTIIEQQARGVAFAYPTDLSSTEDCDRLAAQVHEDHGGVDILINNAGLSIRRSLELEVTRFQDFERTMRLNYFGALKLILAFVPGMRERRRGHIVNVSTMGVQTSGPHFSAYLASKAALDAFARAAASELIGDRVAVTTVYMPLVKTPMSAPTPFFDYSPALTPGQAADMICDAIVRRPKRVSLTAGTLGEFAYLMAPGTVDSVMNVFYRLFPDTARARGETTEQEATMPALPAPVRRLLAATGLATPPSSSEHARRTQKARGRRR
jgi:NAD(P)-dependent dehydrogenase (short-subunit alcohol dehydrogenase family)